MILSSDELSIVGRARNADYIAVRGVCSGTGRITPECQLKSHICRLDGRQRIEIQKSFPK